MIPFQSFNSNALVPTKPSATLLCSRREKWVTNYLLAIFILSSGEQSMDATAPAPFVGMKPMMASNTVRTKREEVHKLHDTLHKKL